MPSKKNEAEVLAAIKARYGNTYDYSKAIYTNAKTPLTIICPKHGEFFATPDSLLSKRQRRAACPKCSMEFMGLEKRMTTEQFITKAKREVDERLDYSNVKLSKASDKVTIICELHGKFQTVASSFLNKKTGCPSCAIQKRDNRKRISQSKFEDKIKSVHGEKYQYDYSDYSNQRSIMKVKCNKHGIFSISAGNFLSGQGCMRCGRETSAKKRMISTEEWINRAKSVHGNKYDYSKSLYAGAHEYITITCSVHGDFRQRASNHISLERGCSICAGVKNPTDNKNKLISQQEFLRRCELAHKDSLLDFTKAKYTGSRNKVSVHCNLHGEQMIHAGNLMRGSGCIQCAHEKNSKERRTPVDEFIERASNAYDVDYDYSEVEFKNLHEKITVICYQHGAWEVIAANHIIGKSGCPTCHSKRFVENAKKINTLTTEDFIAMSVKAHGYKYDYSNTVYSHSNEKVYIVCRKHGEFSQTARLHMVGKGCPKCANEHKSELASTNGDELLERFTELHGNRYTYSLPQKLKYNDKIEITCKEHGVFKQLVRVHLDQKGCPKCSLSKGENAVALWLERNGFDFQVQYPIKDSFNNTTLRFDFYVDALKMLIEYDGQQHFFPVNFGGMSDDKAASVHEMIKKRDSYKDDWAISNDFNLLRIRYDEDVAKVLEKNLSPLSNN